MYRRSLLARIESIFRATRCQLVINSRKFSVSRMTGVFVERLDPSSGKLEWHHEDESYDYYQEIARSGYADMLHDTERNRKYYQALKLAIETMKHRGKKAKVLDIGAGTGILSMMAVVSGADTVIACEVFEPMANCAAQVIAQNGFETKIQIIAKRSTDLTVGEDGDLKERANILVTEVFDTELIGEGAIGTFNHAHQYLLEEDCLVVPSKATVYAQVVESDFLLRMNRLQPVTFPPEFGAIPDIVPPPTVASCPGSMALHDLQLSQLLPGRFKPLTNAVPVFRFNFESKTAIPLEDESEFEVEALISGVAQSVFVWWDLELDPQGSIVLTCAPSWQHPEGENAQWREHWMQATYYLPDFLEVTKNAKFSVHSCHDEYSLWFAVSPTSSTRGEGVTGSEPMEVYGSAVTRPLCNCGAHIGLSRRRIGMLNDRERQIKYMTAMKQIIREDTVCLSIGNGSLLPLLAARFGAKKVYILEDFHWSAKLLQSYIDYNGLADRVHVIAKEAENVDAADLHGNIINLVVSDPYALDAIFPWHHVEALAPMKTLAKFMTEDRDVLPRKLSSLVMGVEFKDFWKIHAPVGNYDLFVLDAFDDLVQSAAERADSTVESQPLCEYVAKAMTLPLKIVEFDLVTLTYNEKIPSPTDIVPQCAGTMNGLVIWMEWHLNEGITVSEGPVGPVVLGQKVNWDLYSMQAVDFSNVSGDERNEVGQIIGIQCRHQEVLETLKRLF